MVKCPGCGAGMRFDPATQMMKCDHCDNTVLPSTVPQASMIEGQSVFESTLYSCPDCGAEVIADEDTVATFCSFCGASVMLERKDVMMAAPSYVLPFQKTKEMAEAEYKKKVRRALFAPKYMKEDAQISKMRGIYIPYWNYDFSKEGEIAYPGTRSYRQGDYEITDFYNLVADVDASYKGLAFDASASFADELSEAIAPFDVRANVNFNAAYLSGFYADTADVQASVYEKEAQEIATTDIAKRVRLQPSFRQYSMSMVPVGGNTSMQVGRSEVSYFPVWFMANRNKDKVSYAVINGQTGKIAVDIPIVFGKYLLGALLIAAPIAVLLNIINVVLTPTMLMVIGIIFAIICYSKANKQLNMLFTRQWYLNDKGLQSVRGGRPRNAEVDKQVAANYAANAKREMNNKTPKATSGAGRAVGAGALWFYGTIAIAYFCLDSGLPLEVAAFVSVALFINVIVQAVIGNSKARKAKPAKKVVFRCPMKQKIGTLIKPLLAIILGLFALLFYRSFQYNDAVLYGGVIAVMILVVISFFELVRLHNKLALRMPRQFAKRGGDENEGI
ncbi:MAG: zinc ribbon domain-containing protein [Lachnospiraceae bacterium]|nr:zinc ribbon domain-containing protein [Lachnospiraceae bacterium]